MFEPGQYMAISMRQNGRPTTTRCFSVASSPVRRRQLEICARVKGKYTTAMENLAPGDEVTVRGPFGRFIFNEETQKRLVLFAGGIGITPFMSMIRYANELHLPNNIHLVYSCRNESDIPFLSELLEIEKNNPNFHITFVLSSGAADTLKNSSVILGQMNDKHFAKLGLRLAEDTYMICGPAPYIKAMRAALSLRGVPDTRLLSEAFSQGKHAQTDTLKRWPINMYALTGVSFALAGLFVTGSDLLKTLPTLKEDYQNIPMEAKKAGDVLSLAPQISTDISQKPIIRYVGSSGQSVQPAPAPTTVAPAPAPVRTVTTTPVARPRTKVS